MGWYIDKGMPALGKADVLIRRHGAVELKSAAEARATQAAGAGIVCVISNGPFEAAGYMFSPGELEAFSDPMDARHRSWLAMDKAAAEKLSGYAR